MLSSRREFSCVSLLYLHRAAPTASVAPTSLKEDFNLLPPLLLPPHPALSRLTCSATSTLSPFASLNPCPLVAATSNMDVISLCLSLCGRFGVSHRGREREREKSKKRMDYKMIRGGMRTNERTNELRTQEGIISKRARHYSLCLSVSLSLSSTIDRKKSSLFPKTKFFFFGI